MIALAQRPKIYLNPGVPAVNEQPAEISTVLGSRVPSLPISTTFLKKAL